MDVKIYTTFAKMKKGNIILIKLLLFIVLLFFPGINAHSNLDTHRYQIEISHDTDSSESRLTPDNDSFEEDQIDQSPISDLSEQPECQKYGFITLPLLNILFVRVWQPPKVF
jgi:hypothetical protein